MRNLMLAMLAAGILAAVIFQVGLDPRIAGLIAGSAFVGVGLYGGQTAWKLRKIGFASWLVLALSGVHVAIVAIPMLAFRLQNWDAPFSKVEVWGLQGPQFHTLSTRFYFLWFIAVVVCWWLQRKKDPGGSFS